MYALFYILYINIILYYILYELILFYYFILYIN